MERIEQIQAEFQEQCFAPVFRSWTQEVAEQYGREYDRNEKAVLMYAQNYLKSLSALQMQTGCTPCVISFSLLWSSLLAGRPALLIEAYEGVPFLTDPILVEKLPAPWLFYHWDQFLEALRRKCGALGLEKYIRYPDLRARAMRGARQVWLSCCMMMKAHLRQLPQTAEWNSIKKGELFCLTAGEYLEHQMPLCGERAELDLAYLERGGDARFSKFVKRVFQGQDWEELLLSDTVFEHCTFQNVSIHACSLCDARLIDCTFEHCKLSELSLMGTEFYAVRLTDTVLEKVWTQTGQSREQWDCLSCGKTSFTNCLLEQVTFLDSEVLEADLYSCQFLGIRASGSRLCPSLQEQAAQEEN